jgi:cytochrome c peroxidase
VSRSAGADALLLLVIASAAAAAIAGDKPPLGVARPLDPPTNPSTPAKVALGAKLFAEPRLSADGTVSCATCHVAALAFTDGRPRAIGIAKKPVARNAPTILNAALHQRLFWDGRSDSLEDQARHPVLNPEEMGHANAEDAAKAIAAISEYPPLF